MEGEVRFTLLDEDGVEKEVKVFFFQFFFWKKIVSFLKKKLFLFFFNFSAPQLEVISENWLWLQINLELSVVLLLEKPLGEFFFVS